MFPLLTGGRALLAAVLTLVAYIYFFASPAQVEAFLKWRVVRVLCAGVDMGARQKAKRYFRVRSRTWIKPAATAWGGGKDGRKEEEGEELGIEAGGGKGKVCVCGGEGGWLGGWRRK